MTTSITIAPADRHDVTPTALSKTLTLFALALGSFSIGSSAFASMGIIQLFSRSLDISLPQATLAITAYAAGVVIGAPLVTISAARLNRRTVLLGLMAVFVLGSGLSAVVQDLGMLLVARFVSGLPHGAYFGAGTVVAAYLVGPGHGGKAFSLVMAGLTVAAIVGAPAATYIGQTFGWREAYASITMLALVAVVAIYFRVPKTAALNGRPISVKIAALRSGAAWGLMAVAATGVSSLYAVYTFVGPMVTEVAALAPEMIPLALAVVGIGMTAGNLIGGFLADRYPTSGITLGYGSALVVLAALAIWGTQPWILFPALFGVGAAIMAVIPTVQVRLTRFAPEAPSLMGALNVASLNIANGLGAWVAGLVVGTGFGYLSTAWAGFALTALGLAIFSVMLRRRCKAS